MSLIEKLNKGAAPKEGGTKELHALSDYTITYTKNSQFIFICFLGQVEDGLEWAKSYLH